MEYINFAVSGNTSRGVLKFLQSDIEKINYIEKEEQIHIFAIGTNDSTREGSMNAYFWVSIEEYKRNMQQIISISKQFAKQTIFIKDFEIDETLTLPWNNTNLYWKNKDGALFETELIKLCELHNVDCISTKDCVDLDDLYDGLYPNSNGHTKIFEKIKNHLENNIL